MHPTLLILCCLVGLAATCAPHSPGCPKLKHQHKAKCVSAFGPTATCSEATITKNSATCSDPTAVLIVDTEDLFGGTDKMHCAGSQWRYTETDPLTGAMMDGPVPGANLNVACVKIPPPGG